MVSEGIFINGEKVTFNPEDILNGDVSAYTEAIGEATQDWLDEHLEPGGSVPIDDTLTIAGAAADAKKTGDEISELKENLNELQNGGYIADAQQIQEKVDNYLEEHPEATTTVQDGSLTESKFSQTLIQKAIKDYVTPEMFGAVGDGVTDDTNAFVSAVATGMPINGLGNTYKIGAFAVGDTLIENCHFVADSKTSHTPLISVAQGKSITLKNCSFTSTNDQSYADYVDGANTSNLYFIYAGSGAKVIDIDGCIFKNGLMDILVQGSTTISTDKIIVKNCTSVGSCMFVDFGYCSDVTIENCIATQNENVNAQSHLIYLGNGDANKAIIKDCTFHEYKGSVIHGYHGSNYDVTMIGCTLVADGEAAAVLLSGDGCTLVADNCSIEAEYPIRCSTGNNIDYLCKNSNIKARGQLVQPSDDSSQPITFKDCIIECRNINSSPSVYVGDKITMTDDTNVLMSILGAVLVNNLINIDNSHQHPIRPRGNCKIIGNTIINESVTTYAWYASGDNNIIKNNVMINFPNKKAGNVETTDNIIIEPVATT